MIQPIYTANQAIANRTLMTSPYFAGKLKDVDVDADGKVKIIPPSSVKRKQCDCEDCSRLEGKISDETLKQGEKLNIKFKGFGGANYLGNNVDYFA